MAGRSGQIEMRTFITGALQVANVSYDQALGLLVAGYVRLMDPLYLPEMHSLRPNGTVPYFRKSTLLRCWCCSFGTLPSTPEIPSEKLLLCLGLEEGLPRGVKEAQADAGGHCVLIAVDRDNKADRNKERRRLGRSL